MMTNTTSDSPGTGYILGHSGREIGRLMLQASILRPITERLLRDAGIREGMRVLDLGCGAGDVAILAAGLVGPSGSVVGVDRSREAVAVAWGRGRAAGLRQVGFEVGSVESFSDARPFDAVVGRYVLIHQSDPVGFIRAAARLARPGGVVAFHELCIPGPTLQSLPDVSLWQQVGEWLQRAFLATLPSGDAGGRLIELFSRAGLATPALFCESLVDGGENSPLYAWVADTLAIMLPQLERLQVSTADEVGIETLEARLRDAVVESCSQIIGPAQFCAWARVTSVSHQE